ncbi:type II secretion system protein GspH [Ahniella affigens]|uniref:Type II secretion system protein H n=1 Tax=Ahniella affigens TaxID=2021234 RepID=A0A2P1PQD6_9GAMM|nr:type II secretion system minor pseudopilin GspH [Ahniella affigens]AVP97042.1 type II secretion system protein GspH [Ahniella affigens]
MTVVPSSTRIAARGVSLIEILVVLVILGVVSSILVLSVRAADGSARARQEAIRLASRLDYACERAELSGRTIGLTVQAESYRFLRAEGEQWQLESDASLKAFKLPSGVRLEGGDVSAAERQKLTPGILCFATGEVSPFQLHVVAGPTDERFRLRDQWPKPTLIERQLPEQNTWQALER